MPNLSPRLLCLSASTFAMRNFLRSSGSSFTILPIFANSGVIFWSGRLMEAPSQGRPARRPHPTDSHSQHLIGRGNPSPLSSPSTSTSFQRFLDPSACRASVSPQPVRLSSSASPNPLPSRLLPCRPPQMCGCGLSNPTLQCAHHLRDTVKEVSRRKPRQGEGRGRREQRSPGRLRVSGTTALHIPGPEEGRRTVRRTQRGRAWLHSRACRNY